MTSAILAPLFYNKAMRLVLKIASLTLTFECVFKYLFRYQKPFANKFQQNYKKEK